MKKIIKNLGNAIFAITLIAIMIPSVGKAELEWNCPCTLSQNPLFPAGTYICMGAPYQGGASCKCNAYCSQ